MKRIIVCILCALSLCSCSSLFNTAKVEVDRTEVDDVRQLVATDCNIKIGGDDYSVVLKAFVNEKSGMINWCLLTSSFNPIPEIGALILVLDNKYSVYLPVDNVKVDKGLKNYYTALYRISETELNDIINNGVKKVRISTNKSYKQTTKEKDLNTISKYFADAKSRMEKQINSKHFNKRRQIKAHTTYGTFENM